MTIVNEEKGAACPVTKQCTKCKEVFPISFFGKQRRNKDGLLHWCKSCCKAYREAYRARLKPHVEAKKRDCRYRSMYGITLEQYNEMLKNQNYRCACCNSVEPSKSPERWSNFSVDHCHETGQVRGLLCNSCNIGIGKLGDTLMGSINAVQYLMKSASPFEMAEAAVALDEVIDYFKINGRGSADIQHAFA